MTINLTQARVPAAAYVAHPHLKAELDRLQAAITEAHTALTSPRFPNPNVTWATRPLKDTDPRKRYHYDSGCRKIRRAKQKVSVKRPMSEVLDALCADCKPWRPPGGSHPDADAFEVLTALLGAWAAIGLTADSPTEELDCDVARLRRYLNRDLPGLNPEQRAARAALAKVLAALWDLFEPESSRIRQAGGAHLDGTLLTFAAAAHMSIDVVWERSAGRFAYKELVPAYGLDLTVLGVRNEDPAGLGQLDKPLRTWLRELHRSAPEDAAREACASFDVEQKPALWQLPKRFPVAAGSTHGSLDDVLDHWRLLVEKTLLEVIASWESKAYAERDRWVNYGTVDMVLSQRWIRNFSDAFISGVFRAYPSRYDPSLRDFVLTVPAVFAAWMDRQLTSDGQKLTLVSPPGTGDGFVRAFAEIRGPAPTTARECATRVSVEDALVTARAVVQPVPDMD